MSLEDLCKDCNGYKEECPNYYVKTAYSCYCELKERYNEKQRELDFNPVRQYRLFNQNIYK